MNTMIAKCTCEHDFQDKEYGKNNRLWNRTLKEKGAVYRCTVCTKEKALGSAKAVTLDV